MGKRREEEERRREAKGGKVRGKKRKLYAYLLKYLQVQKLIL